MRIVSAAAEGAFEDAVSEVVVTLTRALDGALPDLLLVFVAPQYGEACASLGPVLREALGPCRLLGCGGYGVVGAGAELEGRPALSVTALVLPNVDIQMFHLMGAEDPAQLTRRVGASAADDPQLIVLTDPFTCDAQHLAGHLDVAFPGAPKIGGLASGSQLPGQTLLLLDDDIYRHGAVGVALTGDVRIDTVVAQGCRPVGQPMFVTRSQSNVVAGLDGDTALGALQAMFEALSQEEQALARRSLLLGVAMTAAKERYALGDFLIRHLMGSDPETGALSVGAVLQDGDIVQFHVRDAATASDELRGMLTTHDAPAPAGALLFSCLGRGQLLYGAPDHDSDAIRERFGDISVSGFFCNGELGPIAGRTFVHGYTSAIGLLRPRSS